MAKWFLHVIVVMFGESRYSQTTRPAEKNHEQKSDHDWTKIFEILTTIRRELKEHMPYRYVELDTTEADDIIAVLVRKHHDQKILILSGDKDFIQLHNKNVQQYSPVLNKFIGKDENPSIYIKEHILKGDRSDGIPNVLSDDNVFIEGRRQRPLTKKKIEAWLNEMVMTMTRRRTKELRQKSKTN